MADQLRRVIYHEKQEPDSSLCAQHALNNLLQQPIFTAPDLASIARGLDKMEQEYDDNNKGKSTNMDDTGFFSIQVLEQALQVWGLTLIRWRSEEMKEYQDSPHTQLGFILNLEEHWFTIRRFGPADPDPSKDNGVGHWFNLNSFAPKPEWVSRTYLGMVLQQAENDGYSVFVVRQIDPLGELALPRTYADEIAAGIADPNKKSPESYIPHLTSGPSASKKAPDWMPEGLEDEDPELQAALYASVMGEPLEMTGSSAPKLAPIKPISDDWDIDGAVSFFGSKGGSSARSAEASVDESIRRGREELARFQEEQQQALDMDDVDDDPIVASVLSHRDQAQSAESSTTERRPRRAAQDEEEEEMMRRAIEESQRMADEQVHQNDEDEDEDEDMTFDDDDEVHMHDEDEEIHHLNRLLEARRKQDREREELDRIQRATSPPRASTNTQPQPAFETDLFEAEDILQDRIYDDEDAELQAALKASLEGISADITIPPPPKAPTRAITRQDSTSSSTQKATGTNKPLPRAEEGDEDEDEEEEEGEEEETEEEEKEEPTAPKPLTAEELRRARLARFG